MEIRALLEQIPAAWMPTLRALLWSIVIVFIAVAVHRLAKRWLAELTSHRRLAAPVAHVLRLGLRWTVFIGTLLIVLQQFGVLQNVWAAFAAALALVAVGFVAVWSVASNVLCTFLILLSRPFRMDDWLEIPAESLSGTVTDMNLLFTTLRGSEGELIHVPNNTFFQHAIKRRPAAAVQDAPMSNRLELKPLSSPSPDLSEPSHAH